MCFIGRFDNDFIYNNKQFSCHKLFLENYEQQNLKLL